MSNVWFITGAGRGIGAQIAKAALQAGHKIVATGRNLEQLRATYQDVPADKIAFLELDVSNEAQAETVVQAAVKQFGRIDVLVNNAGYGLMGNFEEVSSAAIEHQFATNVFGMMHVMRAVLPVMRSQRSGHIFNISSIGGVLGFNGAPVYCLPPRSRMRMTPATISSPATRRSWGLLLVRLADIKNPPKQFLASSDAIAVVTQSLEGRLDEICAFADLIMSRSPNAQLSCVSNLCGQK